MKKFINYGKIMQFRDVVSRVTHKSRFTGLNENEKPLYDLDLKLPKLEVIATEKVHGSNAGICYNSKDGLWVQSRKQIVDVNNNHMGCVEFVESTKDAWLDFADMLSDEYDIDLTKYTISIFFEWCGGNIQGNKSCVSGLSKRCIIFQHFRITNIENQEENYWLETKINNKWIDCKEKLIFNIMNFKTWQFEIDFNKPSESQNKMIELVNEIEQESPIGKQFKKENNIGEGIVVSFFYKDEFFRFKVKGEKHSKTKVKTLNPVDIKEEEKIIEFANNVCKAWRLEQFWDELFKDTTPSVEQIGDFLKLVMKDIHEEEKLVIEKEEINMKKACKHIASISKKWFFEQLNKDVFENIE